MLSLVHREVPRMSSFINRSSTPVACLKIPHSRKLSHATQFRSVPALFHYIGPCRYNPCTTMNENPQIDRGTSPAGPSRVCTTGPSHTLLRANAEKAFTFALLTFLKDSFLNECSVNSQSNGSLVVREKNRHWGKNRTEKPRVVRTMLWTESSTGVGAVSGEPFLEEIVACTCTIGSSSSFWIAVRKMGTKRKNIRE